MAYVARRTSTNENIGTRPVEQISRRIILEGEHGTPAGMRILNTRIRSRVDGEDNSGYTMDIITHPPTNVRLGQPLRTSVTIKLRSSSNPQDGDLGEAGRLLAVATLVARGSEGSDVPVGPGILTGPRLFDSIHPPEVESDEVVGYASFPDLSISQEGRYRIRIALIRVTSGTGETTQAVDTRSFIVGRN
ncbi:uncharacterized protein K452DRAFT_290152 [Aplosporella prunicola CBS 121167]|uniref:Velvet domain-containing protein n=1 Tax=Aplosporella prunicola CBS 121167 TaxID=1176127 RepID=A0A6A6B7Y5_9PEZI|nr:uncharacterized protein K452DRAFT_290152 [Aplosporella prunicola CBS 121167]KAF2139047.1 hypothetical protein K452DRAFT_290152 [Aplosporella prunicola CBS 121167]